MTVAPVAHIQLLGSFAVRARGTELALNLAEQRLVVCLALHSAPVGRAHLAGVLWPESSQEHAQSSLRTSIWRCHRQGASFVDATATQVHLGGRVVIDQAALLRRIRALAAGGQPALTPADLSHDLLDAWYDEWLVVERERFRQARLHALDLLCLRLADAGRHAEAIDAGLAAVAAEPLRESAHRLLIRAHLAEGNVQEALRQYVAYEALLARELLLGPGPAIRELVSPYLVTLR